MIFTDSDNKSDIRLLIKRMVTAESVSQLVKLQIKNMNIDSKLQLCCEILTIHPLTEVWWKKYLEYFWYASLFLLF